MIELLALLSHNQLWYLAPLVVATSLVYGATRHEYLVPILVNSAKVVVWILGFMGVLFVLLFLVSWGL